MFFVPRETHFLILAIDFSSGARGMWPNTMPETILRTISSCHTSELKLFCISMKRKLNLNVFRCEICGQGFKLHKDVARHMKRKKVHSKEYLAKVRDSCGQFQLG